ncbi:MAG: helix-turn-helix domain-containing protein [Verrucomicrobiaceae bacterium]|nr:helix-turn-helix domain-containing protein [Verrucomicrobiaceae bacterium]
MEYHTHDFVPDVALAAAVFRRDPAFAVLPHHHAFDELIFVRRGRGVHVVEGFSRPFCEGDVLMVRAGQRHHYRDVHDFALESVILLPERIARADDGGRLAELHARCFAPCGAPPGHVALSPPVRERTRRWTREIELAQLRPGAADPVPALTALLGAVGDASTDSCPPMYRLHAEADEHQLAPALAHLEGHFQEADALWPLVDLARMSERTLLRRFHLVTGRSPVTYLGDLRLHHAMLELRKSHHSITEIAYACGFGDLSYFHRRFHQLTGLAPRQWRRKQRHDW